MFCQKSNNSKFIEILGVTLAKKSFIVAMLSLLFTSAFTSLSCGQGTASGGVFSEDFDGIALDPAKWVFQENTNMSGNPAYGGSIKVENSSLCLSSNGSGFPCITSAVNPFPTSGGFTMEFNFTFTRIADWGNGLWFSKGPFVGERDNACSNVVLQVWAHCLDYDQSAILVCLLGAQVYRGIIYGWLPSARTMNFKLQYSGGAYSLFIEGVQVASAESNLRPDTIGVGHPPAYYIPFTPAHVKSVMGGWTSTRIDYIRLLQPSEIALSASATSAQLGFNVVINGTLRSTCGEPLGGANVIISSRVAGDTQWNAISSATTYPDGTFSATWNPTATGAFNLKAAWNGNATHSGASEVKDISVERGTDEMLFCAESNSTLSSLAFNSTANEISFTVSGPSGTSGYVKFVISKLLFENMTALNVLMDGQQVTCNVTSLGDSWQLYFVYSHSTHAVAIRMPVYAPIPELQPWILIVLFSTCTLSVFVYAKRKRRA